MDALYLGWPKLPIYRFGISPNKLVDYMMAGKPVVHGVEAVNDPVADSGCGVSCAARRPAGAGRQDRWSCWAEAQRNVKRWAGAANNMSWHITITPSWPGGSST